jgi:sialidase-1
MGPMVMRTFILFLLSCSPLAAREPLRSDLFTAGQGGYQLYRIPGLVVTAEGTLLAYCEARKNDRSDWGTIDLLLRRSTDGGKTWSEPKKIAEVAGEKKKNPVALAQKLGNADDVTYNNPVMIADSKKGLVHFVFCLEYMRCFYSRSEDDGVTFSNPVEITKSFEAFTKEYDWKVLATGPAHGIQTRSGRLIVPVWLSLGTGGHAHRPSVTSVIFSDDSGKTWERGEIAVPNTSEWINPNETIIVELSDGRVMLNVRSESKAHRRLVTISKNGATEWTKPEFVEALKEPICMASIVRIPPRSSTESAALLFANPDNLEVTPPKKATPGQGRDRKNLSLKLSRDDGKTWAINRVIEPGFSGYSDLAVGKDGSLYCLYERGSTDGKNIFKSGYLTLAKFSLDWVEGKKE